MISFETDVSALAGSIIPVAYDGSAVDPADTWVFPAFPNMYSVSAYDVVANFRDWFNDAARSWSATWTEADRAQLVACPAEDGGISFALNTVTLDEGSLYGITADMTPALRTFLGWTNNFDDYPWYVDSRDLESEYDTRGHWAARDDNYPMIRWRRGADGGGPFRYWYLLAGVIGYGGSGAAFHFPTGAVGTAYCDLFRVENYSRWGIEQGVSSRNGSWNTRAQGSALRRPSVDGIYTELQARAVTVAASVASNPRRAWCYQSDANAWRYLAIADIERDPEGPEHYSITFKAVG